MKGGGVVGVFLLSCYALWMPWCVCHNHMCSVSPLGRCPSLCRLFHLHQGMGMKVVHRDVKASNVLIDAAWHAKLGDFALAKIMGREQAVAATRVVGTFG